MANQWLQSPEQRRTAKRNRLASMDFKNYRANILKGTGGIEPPNVGVERVMLRQQARPNLYPNPQSRQELYKQFLTPEQYTGYMGGQAKQAGYRADIEEAGTRPQYTENVRREMLAKGATDIDAARQAIEQNKQLQPSVIRSAELANEGTGYTNERMKLANLQTEQQMPFQVTKTQTDAERAVWELERDIEAQAAGLTDSEKAQMMMLTAQAEAAQGDPAQMSLILMQMRQVQQNLMSRNQNIQRPYPGQGQLPVQGQPPNPVDVTRQRLENQYNTDLMVSSLTNELTELDKAATSGWPQEIDITNAQQAVYSISQLLASITDPMMRDEVKRALMNQQQIQQFLQKKRPGDFWPRSVREASIGHWLRRPSEDTSEGGNISDRIQIIAQQLEELLRPENGVSTGNILPQ